MYNPIIHVGLSEIYQLETPSIKVVAGLGVYVICRLFHNPNLSQLLVKSRTIPRTKKIVYTNTYKYMNKKCRQICEKMDRC